MRREKQSKTAILIFSQSPHKEAARKRLFRRASYASLTQLFQANLTHVLNTVSSVTEADPFLVHPNPDAVPLPTGIDVLQQEGHGLAEIMEKAATQARARGYENIFFLGSDLPGLTPDLVRSAIQRLETAPSVVGPSPDGGFFILGVKAHDLAHVSDLLKRVPLFTHKACQGLVAELHQSGFSPALLSPLNDVDTWRDVLRLRETPVWTTLKNQIHTLFLSLFGHIRFFMTQTTVRLQRRRQLAYFCFLPAPPLA